MAKKKLLKKRKSASGIHRGTNIEFHSWTFFIFALFVLLAVMILVAQQRGMRLF